LSLRVCLLTRWGETSRFRRVILGIKLEISSLEKQFRVPILRGDWYEQESSPHQLTDTKGNSTKKKKE